MFGWGGTEWSGNARVISCTDFLISQNHQSAPYMIFIFLSFGCKNGLCLVALREAIWHRPLQLLFMLLLTVSVPEALNAADLIGQEPH